jgi:hypothetical protein
VFDTGMVFNAAVAAGGIVGGGLAAWQSKRTRNDMRNGFKEGLVDDIVERVGARVDDRIDARFEAYDQVLAAHLTISHRDN